MRYWILMMSLAACGGSDEHAVAPQVVATARPRAASIEARYEATRAAEEVIVGVLPAEVVLPPEASMILAPPLPGRIAAWAVAVGDEVAVGVPLARLATTDLADLTAALHEAERVANARERALGAERTAMREGLATAGDVQALEVAAAEMRARRDALRTQLAARRRLGATLEVGSAGETGADDDAGAWTWTSPVAGVVQRLELPVGASATPDVAALVVLDVAQVRVRAHVPERWLERATGTRARFWPTGADQPIEATLTRRAPTLEPTSRTLVHDFALATRLDPGRSGRLELLGTAPPDAVVVPAEALTRVDAAEVVFVASAAQPVAIERIGRTTDAVVVRAIAPARLEPGARVAVEGVFLLKSRHVLGLDAAVAPDEPSGEAAP